MARASKLAKAPTRDALHEAALAYLARGAATGVMLTRTLRRRVGTWARRAARGAEANAEEIAADVAACHELIEAIVARFREVGLIDDTAYAEARARSLARSGRSRRAISAKLAAKGVDSEIVRAAVPNDAETELVAAVTFAKKRRVGPFAREAPADRDVARAEKQRALGAFGRAGFGWGTAERVLAMERDRAEELLRERP